MVDDLTSEDEDALKKDLIEMARRDVLSFTCYTKEDYEINWHHKLLADRLNDFVFGKIRFLMVFLPPRHGKSELVSRRLPAFLHGLYPDSEIMAASYLDSLAGDMCIDVQKIIDSKEYQEIFPETKIYPSGTRYTLGTRNSSEHHIVGRKGKYRGQGVGGSFTGKGANFIIIDDPIKGREIADSLAFRERLWNFYNNDLFSRLETDLKTGKKGQVLITLCMTGDTLILMSNGEQKELRNIKIGDEVATYEQGNISTSKIANWKSCGPDCVFEIRTSSGIKVKANERHPFLVCRNGEREWVRLRDLKVNDKMIRVGVSGLESNAQLKALLSTETLKKFCLPLLNTYEITIDHIVEINILGIEEVFDIQVDRTENFIANGLVSHNTRWHEDDLAGRLLELMKKDKNAIQWDILLLPAIKASEDNLEDKRNIGEPLWPEKYNLDQLNAIKSSIGPRAWTSLYQQNPRIDGGGFFTAEMFKIEAVPTNFDYTFIIADTSYKDNHDSDYTVFCHFGVKNNQLYVNDLFRKQIKASEVEHPGEVFIRKHQSYNFRGSYIEPKGHGIYLNDIYARKGLMIPGESRIKEFFADRRLNKVERASNAVPHITNRQVIINENIIQKDEILAEVLAFPKGTHDDFVDCLVDGIKFTYGQSLSILDVL